MRLPPWVTGLRVHLRWAARSRRQRPTLCGYCDAPPGHGHHFDCDTRQR